LILKPRTRPNAIRSLSQAIDFAEIERAYIPARKWANEIERSGHELEEMDNRLNLPVGQDVLLATLQSVAAGALSPDKALLNIRRWLNSGETTAVKIKIAQHCQFV
jgi:hypothetical protein